MTEMKMFAQLDKEDQERVLRLMRAFVSGDINEQAFAYLVCRLAKDATGAAREVALLRVEDGLKWREIAQKTGYSVRWCHQSHAKGHAGRRGLKRRNRAGLTACPFLGPPKSPDVPF